MYSTVSKCLLKPINKYSARNKRSTKSEANTRESHDQVQDCLPRLRMRLY